MEKDKKKKLNIIIIALLLLLVLVIAVVIMNKKEFVKLEDEIEISEDAIAVTASLENAEQSKTDDSIKDDLLKNKYDLNSAKVYQNPYNTSPLSALVVFYSSNKNGKVEVTVKGKHNNDLITVYDAAEYNYIPVYGLYPNYENTVEIKYNGVTKTLKIATEIPFYNYNAVVNYKSEQVSENDFYFITSPIEMSSFAVDTYGDIRWYTNSYYHDIQVLENNHLLIGGMISGFTLSSSIFEIDFLGRKYADYNIESGFLNTFYLKNDGNIIIPSSNFDRDTASDYIIEVDSKTGKIVKTIDVFKLLEKIDSDFTKNLDAQYFFNSGVVYYDETKTLLLTYWGGEFVISINYDKNEINWIFADPSAFTDKFDSYLLKGDIDYPRSMHSAQLQGNLLKVFDNGYSINNEVTDISKLEGTYSSANTYRIDGKNISLVSTHDEDKKLFSYALADYNLISPEDEIVLFGRELENVNYSISSDINAHRDLSTRLIEYIGSEKILDIKLDFASLTVDKIDATKGDKFSFDTIKNINTYRASKTRKIDSELLDKIEAAEMELDYSIGLSNNMLEINMQYISIDAADVILADTNGDGAVYDFKKMNSMLNENIVLDLKAGKYYIYIYENGIMYKTNKYIVIK